MSFEEPDDVIGPNSYLPGDMVATSKLFHRSVKCGNHPDVEAVKTMIGETDRMGSEVANYCEACATALEASLKHLENDAEHVMECENCNSTDNVKPIRDPDEGMAGPVYYKCAGCRRELNAYHARIADECREEDDLSDDPVYGNFVPVFDDADDIPGTGDDDDDGLRNSDYY